MVAAVTSTRVWWPGVRILELRTRRYPRSPNKPSPMPAASIIQMSQ